MKSMNGVHLGLILVFGCLLLFLFAELYYFFWWKKRTISTSKETEKLCFNTSLKNLHSIFCWKKPSNPKEMILPISHVHESQAQQNVNLSKDLSEEVSIDTEIMRLHQMSGPPRFLFTIKEETKEDLESESKSRSLFDLFQTTPFASPTNQHSFNIFLEEKTEAEFNKKLRASPPPSFQFLKDAEDKFHRRNDVFMEKDQKGGHKNDIEVSSSSMLQKHCTSGSSQVLPLAFSPPKTTFFIQ